MCKLGDKGRSVEELTNYTAVNIRACRRYAEMSRADLLKELESYGIYLHQSSLKRIEDGEQPVKVHEAVAFARIFDVGLEDFITTPLDEDEGKLATLLRKYRSEVSELMAVNWSAMESRRRLSEAVENYTAPTSPAKREAEALLDFDDALSKAMHNLSVVYVQTAKPPKGKD